MNKVDFVRFCVAICMIAFSFLATFAIGFLCVNEDDSFLVQWIFSCIALGMAVTGLLWKCGVV